MFIKDKIFRELRCIKCRKLICHEYIFAGRIAYECPRCGETNVFTFKHLKTGDNTDKLKEFTISKVISNNKGGEKIMDQAHKDRKAELEAIENRDENQEKELQLILQHEAETSEEVVAANPEAEDAKKAQGDKKSDKKDKKK